MARSGRYLGHEEGSRRVRALLALAVAAATLFGCSRAASPTMSVHFALPPLDALGKATHLDRPTPRRSVPPDGASGSAAGDRPTAVAVAGGGAGPTPAETPTTGPTHFPLDPAPQPADCDPCEDAERAGEVREAAFPFAAIAGATITAGDTTTTSDAFGHFTLPPPSASGVVVSIAAEDHRTSVVAGWRGGALTHHLARTFATPDGGGRVVSFTVSGRVVAPDDAGDPQPVAGMMVTASAGDGSDALPVTTDADGRYTLTVTGSPTGASEDAVVWAVALDASGRVARLGALSAVTLTPGLSLDDLTIAAPTGAVTLAAPLQWAFPGDLGWELVAVSPGGQRLSLGERGVGERQGIVFDLPGIRYELDAHARSLDGRCASVWHAEVAASEAVSPALLTPPEPTGAMPLEAGANWLWRPVQGADGYRLTLSTGGTAVWEAISELPRLTLPAGLPSQPARLRLVAGSTGGLYSLAATRALRVDEAPTAYASWEGPLP